MRRRPQRIYLGLYLLIAVVTATLVAFLLGSSYFERQRQTEINVRNVAGILEARLEATLRRAQSDLEEMASTTPVQALNVRTVATYSPALHARLALLAMNFPEITGYRLFDAAGNLLYASDQTRVLTSAIRDRDYYRVLRAHPGIPLYFSDVSAGHMTHRPQLYIAVPIRDAKGVFRGIAMAALEISYFQRLFQAVDLGPEGGLSLRRADNSKLVLRWPGLPGTVNQRLDKDNPLFSRVSAREAEGIVHFSGRLDQVDRIYAFRRIGAYPFYVSAGMASQDYLASWRTTAISAVSAAVGFLAVLGLLLWRLQYSEARSLLAMGALQVSEERFQLLLNSAGEGICGVDLDGRCTSANPAALKILGYRHEDDLLGQDLLGLIHMRTQDDSLKADECAIRRALADGRPAHGDDDVFTRCDGAALPVRYDAYPLIKNGQKLGGVLFFSDITERKQSAAQIEFLAHHDHLTSLPNRLLAEDRFKLAAAAAKRTGEHVVMLFLDLDGFKTINDSLGHAIGDLMLKTVAMRLCGQLRESDTVCRFGGDEFLVLIPGVASFGHLPPVLDKLLASLEEPFHLGGYQLAISASIGVAVYPDDGLDFTTLMKKADAAMYHAKDAGRNTYRLFSEAMNVSAQETLRLRSNFLLGLERGEFVLHYQPELSLKSGRVVGAEALVRWRDSSGALIAPGHFIPLAESSGLIVPLGQWVLREACGQAVRWRALYGTDLVVAVNISAIQFKRGDLAGTVADALTESGLPPQLLELELTEGILLNQTEVVMTTLHRLKELGVRLSIDDFGTGYSSLAYLKRLAVDKLKIDQSFVKNLPATAEDAVIVRAIIEMAHRLNLVTIAEGVESEAILDLLRQFECDEAQGFYLSRPLPVVEFERYLASQLA